MRKIPKVQNVAVTRNDLVVEVGNKTFRFARYRLSYQHEHGSTWLDFLTRDDVVKILNALRK